MKREDLDALIPDNADRLLRIWADYMRRGTVGKGAPTKSAGFATGGIGCWDDLEESVDSSLATEVNTILNDMTGQHYCAISNHYASRVWRHRGDEQAVLLEAVSEFCKRAKARALM